MNSRLVTSAAAAGVLIAALAAVPCFAQDGHHHGAHEAPAVAIAMATQPAQPMAGTPTTLAFSFTDAKGAPVTDLAVHHGRRVHVFIIGEDLETVGHVHPEDFGPAGEGAARDGRYTARFTFPTAGRYAVNVDALSGNAAVSRRFIVTVAGSGKMAAARHDMRSDKCFRGYPQQGEDRYVAPVVISQSQTDCSAGLRIVLTSDKPAIRAGEPVVLRYHVEQKGKPVSDLQAYLGAPIHFAVVPDDLSEVMHRHGEAASSADPAGMGAMRDHAPAGGKQPSAHEQHDHAAAHPMHASGANHDHGAGATHDHHAAIPASSRFGPDLVSEPLVFPRPGFYRVFAQMKHGGEIVFSAFTVNAK